MIYSLNQLKYVLDEKNINACINLWGYDVYHDWDWWRVQLPYFLENII
jgi:esterase/lipase superfamily enzyme